MNAQQEGNQNDSKTMDIAKRLEKIESSNSHLESREQHIWEKIEHIDDMRSRGDAYLGERIAYNRKYSDERIEYLKGRIEYNRGYLEEQIAYNREYLEKRIEYNAKERADLEEKFNKLNDKVEKGNTLKSKVEFRVSILIILVIGLIVDLLILLL